METIEESSWVHWRKRAFAFFNLFTWLLGLFNVLSFFCMTFLSETEDLVGLVAFGFVWRSMPLHERALKGVHDFGVALLWS